MKNKTLLTTSLSFALIAALVACGGGGGGGGVTPPTTTPTPTGTSTTTPPPQSSTTNASGMVVDDTTGNPLAGQKVVLEPWTAAATPLPSPQATTAANGTFTLNGVPNGHYLLVIGNDTPGQTTTAVVHDSVTLAGGNQTLKAPTLPTIPGYTAPTWETNGDYRIATLDSNNEVPCFTEWNTDRAAHGLTASVPDEWLQENVRAEWAYNAVALGNGSRGANGGYLTSYETQVLGGGTCGVAMVDPTFTSNGGVNEPVALSANELWYGAIWKQYTVNGSVNDGGYQELPYDPRYQSDPAGITWP